MAWFGSPALLAAGDAATVDQDVLIRVGNATIVSPLFTESPDVYTSPTGQSVTASLGTPVVSADSSVSPSGYGTTASLGTPTTSADHAATPTGYSVTASLGTPTEAVDSSVSPTGQSVTASLGTPDVAGGASVEPTGFEVTAALGAPVLANDYTVTPDGFEITAGLGEPTAAEETIPDTPPPTAAGVPPIPTRWQRIKQRPMQLLLPLDEEPVRRDAMVAVSGFGLRVGLGTTWQVADCAIAPAGYQMQAALGWAEAEGMHNPTDEQIIEWLIAAVNASI